MSEKNSRNKWIEGAKIIYHPAWIRRWRQDPFSVPPIYVEVSPVGMCNHRCTFCAVDMLGYPNRSLNADMLIQRIQEMKQMRDEDPDGLGVKSIQFAGEGEPTLHKELPRIYEATRAAGIDIGMLTNGTALNERMARGIIPHVNGYLQTSINGGTKESYPKIHRCSPEHWNLLWRNLKRTVAIKQELGAKDCDLGANMTVLISEAWDPELKQVTPSNWQEMESLVQLVRDTGLNYVSFKPYSQHRYSTGTAKMYGNMSYKDLMKKIYEMGQELIAKYGSSDFEVIFRFTRFEEYEKETRPYVTCQATPTIWSYIQSDGVWISCSAFWTQENFHLGNINTQTVKEIWYGQKRREHLKFVQEKLDISECRKTCHPDKENVFLNQVKNLSDEDFEKTMGELAIISPPKRKNFI